MTAQTATISYKPGMHAPDSNAVGRMLQLIYGRFAGQAICLAAKLGIADLITAGRKTTQDLASILGANPSSLRRFLQVLASNGILAEGGQDHWGLTPAGELLRGDAAGSLRDLARFFAQPAHAQAWLELEHSVLTGAPAFDHVHGVDAWTYAQQHAAFNESFNAAMSNVAGGVHRAITGVYDFSGINLLVDVGGGHGRLITHILELYPTMRGILYDMPHVVDGARDYIAMRGLADRCQVMGGDFFTSVPAGADAYLLTAVLHDWNDEASATILRNCRAAMQPGGRVLIGDFVLKPSNEPDFGKTVDLEMLVITPSGRERTETDFRNLLNACDLRLNRVIQLPTGNSLLEAIPT